MGIVFVPIYLKYIGPEGYGLIGFFTMISAVLMILDGGFGAAASRELARNNTQAQAGNLNDLIRTLEYLFWILALALGFGLVAAAPLVTHRWLHLEKVDPVVATDAVRLMGASLLLQWPAAYYRGCIIGLQRQIGLNTISAVMATIKGAGAVVILWKVAPTIRAFFAWQIVAAFLNIVVLRRYLWRHMPRSETRAVFRLNSVHKVGSFAAMVGITNVLSLVLAQLDKIILSKVLTLSLFGYYTLAATMSGLIYQFIGPVFNAFYPRITQTVFLGTDAETAAVYHRACQTMAIGVMPISLLMAFYGRDMVWVWTSNAQLAQNIHLVLACLALGTMLNGVMTIPYALQLANGWTLFGFWQNVIAVCLLAPLIYVFATRFGLIGAAAVWPLLNIGYVSLSAPIMYRRLLPAEMRRWYVNALLIPLAANAVFMGCARMLLDACVPRESKALLVPAVAGVFLVSVLLTAWLLPEFRQRLQFAVKSAARSRRA